MRTRPLLPSLLLSAIVCTIPGLAAAQQLELPRPSPNAKMVQTVGLTDITVDYSSPAVKGRKIFGGLLPYGELWRAGANAATKVTFSRDVVVGATPVPAGSYSLFVIPGKTTFTMVLNKDAAATVEAYKKDLDVVRVDVKPQPIANRERLAYVMADFSHQQANLDLEWEKVRLSLPIKLHTEEQVAASMKSFEDNAWAPYNQIARYDLEQKKDYDAGLAAVDKSIAMKEDFRNLWTKAQLLAAKGKHKEALALAQKVNELGQKVQPPLRFFYADEVKKALVDWKK